MSMLSDDKLNTLFFPHKEVREIQDQMLKEVEGVIEGKKHLIMHAPTGLGKTASTLPVALAYALKNKKTVFFLTSRHTQHKIAIDTMKAIKEKFGQKFVVIDIIGKKWMCPVPGTDILYSNEFNDYCKKVREDRKCEFYINTKQKNMKPTVQAKNIMEQLINLSPAHIEQVVEICSDEKLCPYEMTSMIGKKATVIVADYYYIFNPSIRNTFFNKAGKKLEDSIIIVDEAHNLPIRVRDLMTQRLSTFMLKRAIKEVKKYNYQETLEYLEMLLDVLKNFGNRVNFGEEVLIKQKEFMEHIEQVVDYEQLVADLEFIAEDIREKQKQSYTGGVAVFLDAWLGQDTGFARILSKKEYKSGQIITLSYRCLDPSLVTKEVMDEAHSVILMSGTLTPTSMYKDVLGFGLVDEKVYPSPFPKKNILNLIVPETTTKFTARTQEQYKRIAEKVADIVNLIPGNSAVFFPSYYVRDCVNRYFSPLCKKTTFTEAPSMSKTEKQEMLDNFKSYKDAGAVLLGIASANFAEGIDLPGDLLKAVIVVGLPLQKPDLETKELIKYYDEKFGRGWDYGYLFPAMNKCFQSAGRCIRSETDRGVIVFLDERFVWQNYKRCFPQDWNIIVTKLYQDRIKEFFG